MPLEKFRQGEERLVSVDSGQPLKEILPEGSELLKPTEKSKLVLFGSMSDVLEEGTRLYTRRQLLKLRAHQLDQRGINGNIKDGCDSVIVAQEDGPRLDVFDYISTRRQGAGAVYRSYELQKPIRVFRSSRLRGLFAPPMKDATHHQYRYDGLYKVKVVLCSCNRVEQTEMMTDQQKYRFQMHRIVDRNGNKLPLDVIRSIIKSSRSEAGALLCRDIETSKKF